MATVNMASASTKLHVSRAANVKLSAVVEVEIDFAKAAAKKGSALAASDVIEAIRIPAGSVVIFAGAEVTKAVDGDATVNIGDGLDPDRWAAAFTVGGAAVGSYAPMVVSTANPTMFGTADTVDVVLAGTDMPTKGVLRVFAMIADVSDAFAPGLVKIGS